MCEERAKYIKGGWLKTNLNYSLIGVLVGLIIILFISAWQGRWISMEESASQILFSVVISLSVTNSICFAQELWKLSYENLWSFLVIYYSFSIVGMIVGIELSFFLVSLVFNKPYTFFHPQAIYFSSLIVIIVCTILYTYNAQKERLNSRLKERELDLVRLKQLNTQAELAALHSKINPHFLYNSLNSIASLIHEDPDKAEAMTLKLSKLFRYSINHNQENMVQVRDELEIGNTYLDIEKVRFGNRIRFSFEVDEGLLDTKIPRFLIQPLVENALKHGLNQITENGELCISIQKAGDYAEITVADNGKPFPAELQTGYGLQSTYEKLNLLYGDNYQLQMTNEPVKSIKILIPITI